MEAMSYSLDTSRLPKDFDGLWDHIIRVVSSSLRNFHEVSGADAMVWFDLTEWVTRSKRPTLLLAVYFCTDARARKEDLNAFEPALGASGLPWAVDGVMVRPRKARPVLVTVEGEPAHIWIERPEHKEAFTLMMGAEAERVTWRTHRLQGDVEAAFLPEMGHVIGRLSVPDPSERARVDRLKLVFAHSVAHRIVEADGVVDEGEAAFLQSRFPPERLAALELGPEQREEALAEAEAELATLLGHHEKLALLSTFYAACYADGRLEVRELRVLKEAAAVLGLERDEVVGYLQRLW